MSAEEEYWKDDFRPLQASGKLVLQALREDEAAPDADLYRRITNVSSASQRDHHYFLDPSSSSGDGNGTTTNSTSSAPLYQMEHERSVPVPPLLTNQLKTAKKQSLMGLFPEAQLAWMTVDEKLFLWSTSAGASGSNPTDFLHFQVPSSSHREIVSVGLVPPKKGAFEIYKYYIILYTYLQCRSICLLTYPCHFFFRRRLQRASRMVFGHYDRRRSLPLCSGSSRRQCSSSSSSGSNSFLHSNGLGRFSLSNVNQGRKNLFGRTGWELV